MLVFKSRDPKDKTKTTKIKVLKSLNVTPKVALKAAEGDRLKVILGGQALFIFTRALFVAQNTS